MNNIHHGDPLERPAILLTSMDHERLSSLLKAASEVDPSITRFLREELERADIARRKLPGTALVTMGSEVKFVEHDPARIRQVRLVYPGDERNSSDVSVLTPIGSALIGLGPGQSISWTEEGDEQRVTVLEVQSTSAQGEHVPADNRSGT